MAAILSGVSALQQCRSVAVVWRHRGRTSWNNREPWTSTPPTAPPARRSTRSPTPEPRLVLGHGAAGSINSADLQAATEAALAKNVTVALVEQPYLVAGRRSAAPAPQLDTAWKAVIAQLPLEGLPLIVGGRSSGARVACRTAAATNDNAVVCLAFPVHRPAGPKSRLAELDAVTVPVLVVQGRADPFGMPPAARPRGHHRQGPPPRP